MFIFLNGDLIYMQEFNKQIGQYSVFAVVTAIGLSN